jgi:hydroxymethylpyrimidine/phosphomethylpyrimidine kinase
MLASAAIVGVVADAIKDGKLFPYVCDPVIFAKSGARLLKDDAVDAVRKWLFPLATLVTPNRREAAAFTGAAPDSITSIATAKDAAKRIVSSGAKAVVIKGIEGDGQTIDLFFDGREFTEYAQPTLPKEKTHGSGCAFSAAITAGLANRLELAPAIDQAKQLVTMAIQYSDGQGRGTAPVNVLAFTAKKK